MKASELRIGNLCYLNLETLDHHVTTVIPTDLIMLEEGKKHLSPIPLTEEWLSKFGFVKQENGIWWLIEFYTPTNRGSFGVNYITGRIQIGSDYETQAMKSVKNVHQLQNLYFALSGEELQVIVPSLR